MKSLEDLAAEVRAVHSELRRVGDDDPRLAPQRASLFVKRGRLIGEAYARIARGEEFRRGTAGWRKLAEINAQMAKDDMTLALASDPIVVFNMGQQRNALISRQIHKWGRRAVFTFVVGLYGIAMLFDREGPLLSIGVPGFVIMAIWLVACVAISLAALMWFHRNR